MLSRLTILAVVFVLIFSLAALAINTTLVADDLAGCNQPGDGKCAPADAIVAVSGGDTISRAQQAIDMYLAGWAKWLIFSGASADPNAESNAEVMRQVAISAGVPEEVILKEDRSQDTKENADYTVAILHQLEANNVILVSSPYHLRRVKANFERADSEISFRTSAAVDMAWSWWFLKPRGWQIALTELAGLAELVVRVR